jgi:hypothetical protein
MYKSYCRCAASTLLEARYEEEDSTNAGLKIRWFERVEGAEGIFARVMCKLVIVLPKADFIFLPKEAQYLGL